jgi:hypothetical protein
MRFKYEYNQQFLSAGKYKCSCVLVVHLFECCGVESILGPLGTAATPGLLYLPRVIVRPQKLVE